MVKDQEMSNRPMKAHLPRPPLPALLTSAFRPLPDFLILGTQKAGTTSLFASLGEHPSLWIPTCKECHYFDQPWKPSWVYRSFFLLRTRRERLEMGLGHPVQLGEATPYYLYHPRAPQRAFDLIPNAKLVVILRDPVQRAYSHYAHSQRRRYEPLSFEEALEQEEARTHGEEERLARSAFARSDPHQRYTYFARGLYAQQLKRWMALFPQSQFHVEFSEDLFIEPERVVNRIETFLGVPCRTGLTFPKANAGGKRDKMSEATAASLRSRYAEANAELESLLGRSLPW